MEKKNVNKVEISQEYGKESIRLAINQISIQNCDGSVNEKAIKSVGLLQEIDIEDYANQRVIAELESLHIYPDTTSLKHGFKGDGYVKEIDVVYRIKQLKQY